MRLIHQIDKTIASPNEPKIAILVAPRLNIQRVLEVSLKEHQNLGKWEMFSPSIRPKSFNFTENRKAIVSQD